MNLFDDPAFGATIPFVRLLGFVLTRFEGGHSTIALDPRPEHLNSYGVAHGGVVMTLLDVGMVTALRSLAPGMGGVTIEMKTSFLRGATGALRCEGTIKHRTNSLGFTEATVYDSEGQACAHATGTFKLVKPRPAAAAGGVISTD